MSGKKSADPGGGGARAADFDRKVDQPLEIRLIAGKRVRLHKLEEADPSQRLDVFSRHSCIFLVAAARFELCAEGTYCRFQVRWDPSCGR